MVYQKSYKLALEIHKVTRSFPKEEVYGLTSLMRRSAVSIPCNIAKGIEGGTGRSISSFFMWHMDHAMSLKHFFRFLMILDSLKKGISKCYIHCRKKPQNFKGD